LSLAWFFEGPAGAPENDVASSDIEFSQAFSQTGVYKVKLYAYREFSFMGEVSIVLRRLLFFRIKIHFLLNHLFIQFDFSLAGSIISSFQLPSALLVARILPTSIT